MRSEAATWADPAVPIIRPRGALTFWVLAGLVRKYQCWDSLAPVGRLK